MHERSFQFLSSFIIPVKEKSKSIFPSNELSGQNIFIFSGYVDLIGS